VYQFVVADSVEGLSKINVDCKDK